MKNLFSFCSYRKFFQRVCIPTSFVFLFVFPASNNYQLKDYNYGGGGVGDTASTNYNVSGTVGEQNENKLLGATYNIGPGLFFINQANVPPAPTFTNPANYYNKLKLVLDTGGNPTDTTFAIAISDDDWVTTKYVQNDDTVGATLGSEDRQIYAAWGSGSGFDVIGLAPGTTYKVKVKAMQGKFTETGYGPEASAATVNPQLSFDIDIGTQSSDDNGPPFSITFPSLPAGSVTDSPVRVWVDFSTNGASGGRVYVSGANGGLSSLRAGSTISSVTGDLAVLSSGYGAQGVSAVNGLSIVAPYAGAGSVVGVIDTTIREVFSASGPASGGRASFLLKAKSDAVTPAAGDYTDTLTVIASASF